MKIIDFISKVNYKGRLLWEKETMNLENHAWLFKGALSAQTCDSIIKIGLSRKKSQALTYDTNRNRTDSVRDLEEDPLQPAEKEKLLTKRNSHIVWLDEQWIFDLLHPYISLANKNADWNFHWDWTESS